MTVGTVNEERAANRRVVVSSEDIIVQFGDNLDQYSDRLSDLADSSYDYHTHEWHDLAFDLFVEMMERAEADVTEYKKRLAY